LWGVAWAELQQRLCSERSWEALRDWALFQKVTLWSPRGGKGHKGQAAQLIRSRVDRFKSGDLASLWDEFRQGIPRQKSTAFPSLEDKVDRLQEAPFLNTLRGLVEDGAFGKAVRHLMSDGLHDPLDHKVQAKLRDLHPRRPEVIFVEPVSKVFPFPKEESSQEQHDLNKFLRETLLSFPRAAAAGPDGLRPQHLQDVVRVDAGAAAMVLAALRTFSKAALEGSLPAQAMPFISSATLIPLRKDGPNDSLNIRPIAVGNTLRRFVGKFAMTSPCVKQRASELHPHQCGVTTEGACETIAQGVQSFAEHGQGDTWATMQVDLQNAFNAIDPASPPESNPQSGPRA
jgi:hypothetical protein